MRVPLFIDQGEVLKIDTEQANMFSRMIDTTGANPAALTAKNVKQRLGKRAKILAAIRRYFDQRA